MNSSRKLCSLALAAAVALLSVGLVAPVANADKVPPLVTTAQYKALVSFIDKLDEQARTPATAARKAAYGDQLANKHQAAVNKSTALFNRGKKAARAESQRAFKAGARTIRRTEAGELAALRRQYDARMGRAASIYERAVGRVEDAYNSKTTSLRRQIQRLRKQKAHAKGELRKAEIEEAIERRVRRIAEDGRLERKEISHLAAGYRREKAAIRGAKASATQVVMQTDDEAIETLRNRGQRIYNTRVRTLQSRRVNQLRDLENKLKAGRAAIARMPVSS